MFSQSCWPKVYLLHLVYLHFCLSLHSLSSGQQAIFGNGSQTAEQVSAKVIKRCPMSHLVHVMSHTGSSATLLIFTPLLSSLQSHLKQGSRAVPRSWSRPAIHHPQRISRNKLPSPLSPTNRHSPTLHLPKRMLMTSFTSCQSNTHPPLRPGWWNLETVLERRFGGQIIRW